MILELHITRCLSKSLMRPHFFYSVVRASVGAMTTEDDVETFISFLQRCFMVRNHLTIEKDDGSSETSLGSAAPVASIISSAG